VAHQDSTAAGKDKEGKPISPKIPQGKSGLRERIDVGERGCAAIVMVYDCNQHSGVSRAWRGYDTHSEAEETRKRAFPFQGFRHDAKARPREDTLKQSVDSSASDV
jgi:hypothetical protein